MKKITLLIVMLVVSWQMSAQFGCGSAVPLTNGFTATGITTPGNAGPEDWNDNPTDATPTNNLYWDDDVYLYSYTAGTTPEEISMTIFSINSWNGIGIFANCSGTLFSGHIMSVGTTGANVSKTVTANLAPNQTVYIAIGQWGTPDGLNFNVTNFTATPLVNPPSCVSLTTPANMAVNVSSPIFTWPAATGAATDYMISLGTTPGGAEILNNVSLGNVLTFNAGSLALSTTYYVRITPSNSNGVAVGPCTETSFTTCSEVSDFTENFEAYPSSTTSLPNCWSRAGNSTLTYITTGAVAPMSPTKRLLISASGTGTTPTEAYAILPPVSNLQAGTHRLKFTAFTTSGTDRTIEVGYLTDPSDVTTFVQLQEIALPGTVIANAQQFVVTPTGVPAGVKKLVIKNPGYPTGATAAYLDDVSWAVIPACANPTGIASSMVTSTTASISWSSDATAASWEIEYGPTGFTLGMGTVVAAPTNPFVLTGLTPTTAYQYYVRSVCAGPLTSSSSLVGSFTTTCASYVPDYTQNFATFPPSCWSRAAAGDLTTGPTGTATGIWAADGFLNSGTTGAVKVNLYNTNRIGWLVSPTMDLSAGGYRVRYDVAATTWGGTATTTMAADDVVQFVMSTDSGATWTALETYNTTNTPTNASVTKVYNIPAQTSATTKFAFYANDGLVDEAQDYDFFIDNFVVETPPATAPACAANVVGTPDPACGNKPFTITWDATTGATGYNISVGTTAGGTDIANNVDLGFVTTYTYATTMPNTTYYYTVVPYNTIGTAMSCVEQSLMTFPTPCACTPVYTTGVTDGDLISNVVITGTTLSNNSGAATTGPSYTYFTGQPNYTATLQAGSSYPVVVTVGTYGTQNVAVWIDYNDNLTFEPSEKVGFTTTSIGANASATFNISLACNPPLGVHRMRIRDVFATSGATIDPCNSYGYGETEDYDVTISAAVACPQPSNLMAANITTTSADLTWNIGCAETMWDLHFTTAGGGAPTGTPSNPNVSSPYMATMLTPSTSYEFYVRADCVANGTSLWTGPFTFSTSALPPSNDDCLNATVLTAGGVFGDNSIVGTNVAATSSTETAPGCASFLGGDVWYSVAVPASGTITFEVNTETGGITDGAAAVYSGACGALVLIDCDDSSSTDPNDQPLITVTGQTPGDILFLRVWAYGNGSFGEFRVSAYDASLSSSSFDNASFMAYPNPVKDVLNLSYSTEINSVKVINLLGQEVISRKVGNTSTQLDMTNLTAGAYIVNVTIGDVVKTIKVIKQ